LKDRLVIIPFEPEHLYRLRPRGFEAKEMELLGDPVGRVKEYLKYGVAYTGCVNGDIIGCAGLFRLWPGVAEVWAVTTPLVEKYPVSFHKAIYRGLERLQNDMGLWRIQTAIHKDHWVSQEWVKRMGFEFEGDMPGYGPDKSTYRRFARSRCLS